MTLPSPDADPISAEEQVRLAAERRRLQADAVSGSLWISVHTVVSLPVAVIANVVVAHSLGARHYGTLMTYTAVYGMVVALLNLGISDASVQWIAAHNARDEKDAFHETIRRCSGYHAFVEAPAVALLAAFLLRNAGGAAMCLGAVSSAAIMLLGTSTVVMSGTGLNGLAARISIVTSLASQAAVILAAASSPLPTSIFLSRLAVGFLGPVAAFVFIPREARSSVLRPISRDVGRPALLPTH